MNLIAIQNVQRGDVIEFKSYALRVEDEPIHGRGTTILRGRTSEGANSLVTKHFLNNRFVNVR